METKLNDVIHLYLGGKMMFNKEDRMFIKNGDIIDITCSSIQSQLLHSCYIPILRTLSDITIEEQKVWQEYYSDVHYKCNCDINSAKFTLWLCKKQFDVFGLIESKQAVDKTQLK